MISDKLQNYKLSIKHSRSSKFKNWRFKSYFGIENRGI